MPSTTAEWVEIADNFELLWQFPHCLGAIDGKHIKFQAPRSAGSFYYNYKKFNTFVLLAVCDAEYNFIYIDVGVNGCIIVGFLDILH